MKKIKFYCDTGYIGSDVEEIFEYSDNTTEDEIERDFFLWLDNYVSCGWSEYNEEDNNENEDETDYD